MRTSPAMPIRIQFSIVWPWLVVPRDVIRRNWMITGHVSFPPDQEPWEGSSFPQFVCSLGPPPQAMHAFMCTILHLGLPWWLTGQRTHLKCRRHRRCGLSLGQEDPWRRKWRPTLVFLPGKPHGQRSLVGYRPWGHKELDTTEHTGTDKLVTPVCESLYFTLNLSPKLWSPEVSCKRGRRWLWGCSVCLSSPPYVAVSLNI